MPPKNNISETLAEPIENLMIGKQIDCANCGGHGVITDMVGEPDECRDCGGSGRNWLYPKGAIARYYSGPLIGKERIMTDKDGVSSEGVVDALVPYLRHTGNCSFLRFQYRDEVCRCGLEKAIVALRTRLSTIPNVDEEHKAAPLSEDVERMREALVDAEGTLETAAKTFRRYGEIHRTKGTTEGNLKAGNNDDLAEFVEAGLATVRAALPPIREGINQQKGPAQSPHRGGERR